MDVQKVTRKIRLQPLLALGIEQFPEIMPHTAFNNELNSLHARILQTSLHCVR